MTEATGAETRPAVRPKIGALHTAPTERRLLADAAIGRGSGRLMRWTGGLLVGRNWRNADICLAGIGLKIVVAQRVSGGAPFVLEAAWTSSSVLGDDDRLVVALAHA